MNWYNDKTWKFLSWSTSELRVRLVPLNRFKSSSKIFYWPFQGGTSFVDLLRFCSVLCLLCLCACLFTCALWSPAGKGLTSWLSFLVSNCEFVTFPLVSWVRCGTWLYRFLIFAPLLTLMRCSGPWSADDWRTLQSVFTDGVWQKFCLCTLCELTKPRSSVTCP